jgi:hypothetical protein
MERTWYGYDLGFPARGFWAEAFNSDVYDTLGQSMGREKWSWHPRWRQAAKWLYHLRLDRHPGEQRYRFRQKLWARAELSGRIAPWSG